jgi:hypothetical protein
VLLRVRNIGGGPARQITFYLVIGDLGAAGDLPPDGFLSPGQAASVEMHFPPGVNADDARYVLMCLDRETNTYGWSRQDREKVYRAPVVAPQGAHNRLDVREVLRTRQRT